MADVIVELRILPRDIDVDIEKLEEEIALVISPQKISRESIAFGLVAINVAKVVKDEGGQIDELEKKLKTIEGVGQVEVVRVTRAPF